MCEGIELVEEEQARRGGAGTGKEFSQVALGLSEVAGQQLRGADTHEVHVALRTFSSNQTAGHGRAGQGKAGQGRAEQGKAKQGKAKQGRAGQCTQ